jgi:hypothetical protein
MITQAAIFRSIGAPLAIKPIPLDSPRDGAQRHPISATGR